MAPQASQCETAWIWPGILSGGDTSATGWPSTTTPSTATSVLVGFIAAGTSTIRVGSGGVMLLNHAPLVIAEQFGSLESLYPGRIDLGVGRAPGTDIGTAGWPLARQPYLLETSLPGVLAVGDVHGGRIKRVASAVGEGSIAGLICK